ncbi:hypothetical protein JKF63_00785 [Porcisia hertigi]|uniref:Uncharacterized protein n=1 Tax=Porcisia hertigi TaxID=2761500 RepID=A0A836IA76_9TRYP|nr:hypothetical protein JKF63_00785 [Porcisia hertigi]
MERTPSSFSARAQKPSSSRGADRGGRGQRTLRGGEAAFRGRGGGAGDARGRGRGDGHHGGRGSLRRKPVRHRSLSGKHGTHTPQDEKLAAKRAKKEQKPNSNFALLHSMFGDAATIAEYIREYHSSDKFRDIKSVNTFLQAVSQRPEAVYGELMSKYKDEILTTLERLFALYALSKNPMTPSAHEFLIRCEQEGVRKSAWGEGVHTLPAKETKVDVTASTEGGAEGLSPSPQAPAPAVPPLDEATASLLSPRELLKKLAALDAVGRLQRLIELSRSVEDIQVCAKKLTSLFADRQDDAESGDVFYSTRAAKLDYAAKCQLISKLLSKARRLVEPAFTLPAETATGVAPTHHARVSTQDATVVGEEDEVSGGEGDEKPAQTETIAASYDTSDNGVAATVPVTAQCRGPLTDDEVKSFQAIVSVAFHALETVLEQRSPSVTQQPFSKFSKMLEWCKEKGLLSPADERFIALLEQKTESDIAQQASELETVIKLKSLTAGDTPALREVVDQLWEAGCAKFFLPSSVDVLSAIAVAASVDGIDADVKRMVADRLAQTQRHLAGTVALPRRALRFVNDERNKVKQAAIAKQLEEEASQYRTEDKE